MPNAAARNSDPHFAPTDFDPLEAARAYWTDAWQRGVLFLDVLQQRSERYQEHAAKVAPHVLKFGCELVMDGASSSARSTMCLCALHRRQA